MFQVGGILSAVPKAFFIFVSRPIRKMLFRPHRVILAAVPYAATGRKKIASLVCHQRVHVISANVFVCPDSRKHMLARHREGLALVRGHAHARIELFQVHALHTQILKQTVNNMWPNLSQRVAFWFRLNSFLLLNA